MKRGSFLILFVCFFITIVPMTTNASSGTEIIEKENIIIQSKFTNITVFYNDFYITNQGKAVLTSIIDARNVDECKLSMYLQRYQGGKWVTVKHWSVTENGTSCGLGKNWYVISGYQYRMKTYAYVYLDDELIESSYYLSRKKIF